MGTNDMTLSAWIKTSYSGGTAQYFISKSIASAVSYRYALGLNSCKIKIFLNAGGADLVANATSDVCDGEWHHIIGMFDRDGDMEVYVDGLLDLQVDISSKDGVDMQSTYPFRIGAYSDASANPTFYFNGKLSQVSVWNRVLTSTEIQQLYRRGGNRPKYQVKTCVDASCNCSAYSGASPNSTDCNGDGVLNVNETDFTSMSDWLGNNGTNTNFSELQNCSSLDGNGDCSGTINTASPDFSFANFPLSSQPANQRYFQYRVLMEAEENTACSSGTTTCMPDLTSVEVAPTGRYYGGSAVITSNDPTTYTNLKNIFFNEGGSCSLTYQLSPDASTYYYWNGFSWVSGTSLGQSNTSSEITSNIINFSSQVGSGNIYLKAFLTSDTTQPCELDEVSVESVD